MSIRTRKRSRLGCGVPSRHAIAATIVIGLLAQWGCASKPGELFAFEGERPAWPMPPEQPRVRYLGELRQDKDLKPGRSAMEGLRAVLFGRTPPQEMIRPLGVCTDGADRVFVVDSAAAVVHVFDLAKRTYARWSPPEGYPEFGSPVAVAWDNRGRLLVCDSSAQMLFVFDSHGVLLGTLGEGFLVRPCGVAIDAERDRVLVVDSALHQVVVMSSDGTEIGRIGRRGTGHGEFNFPTSITLGENGRMFVSDSLNFRVQVLDAGGTFLGQIGRKGDLPGYFSQPKGVALDPDGHVYVVDANFEAVQLFQQDGTLLMTFGHEGHGPGEFWLPVGIHIDANARVWIADSYNRRVQVFEYLGQGDQQ